MQIHCVVHLEMLRVPEFSLHRAMLILFIELEIIKHFEVPFLWIRV